MATGLRRWTPFASLAGYQRSWVPADAVAAVTLLAIALPEQLATSRLAGMPPITGYFAFVAGTVVFAALGTSPVLSVGADSTIAPLFAVGIAHFAPSDSARYVALIGILAVMVGILVALVGLLRLGWIAEFLSAPIVTGFLAGVAVVIVIHQVPDLLGLPAGGGSNLHRIESAARHLGDTNGPTAAIAAGVLALVVGSERIGKRLQGPLVGLVAATAIVALGGLRSHGVAVLGNVSHAGPQFGLADLSWRSIGHVAPVAGVVALVVVIQTAATGRAFPGRGGSPAGASRDFVAVGAGSIVAGLAGSFPVNTSPPRSAALSQAGARSQAAGLGAAAAVVALIPAAGLLHDVPLAALGAMLTFVAARIFHVRELVAIGRYDLVELALALVALLTVALVGVEQGIGVAVGLAILDRTRLSARPQLHVLGRLPGTTSWTPLSSNPRAAQQPGVLVVLFATPLWYANADAFRAELHAARSRAAGPVRAVVLDVIGMSDLDYTGSLALGRALDELGKEHVELVVARAGSHVRESLDRNGLLQRIGSDHFYPTVNQAVTAVAGGAPSGDGAG